ncbi:hypothetical protein B0T10DRAFT_493879 [Thelonectria olida]|uniref:DUF7587 domain-containing protein n=1 Tax=Thelonectria olida TaxID=1576542 RepID=A0A9P8VY80_9HYPO|nr:hypothetical protein B0T10DRAFT_493879 [Thelonectria olida]
MIGEYYDAPCEITSLTGSLLWGLNYAHWLLSRGYGDIQIFLVDTWKMPKGRIYPAKFLATYLGVAPRNIHWHDDPYHEYFMFGGVPSNAILGSVNLESVRGREINTLLPGFHQLDRDERLHESLDRFRKSWTNIFGFPADAASVTNDDIWAAGWTAGRILQNPDKNIHFQIAMMFLSLRKRDWNKEVWVEIQNVFEGVWLQCNTFLFLDFTNFAE